MLTDKIKDNNNIILNIKNIFHKYNNINILKNISFHIKKGEIISILGSSGCGKSTLLRVISGIEPLSKGQIFIENEEVAGKSIHIAPEKRGVGLVFQDLALFPHIKIQKNIEYGLSHLNKLEKKARVFEMLTLVKMESFHDTYPHLLSGGQQQRVALARSLAPLPKILLLDEPFSGLDMNLRRTLCLEVRNILKQSQMTSLFVTHDATEALMFSDKIIILNNGEIEQFDTPQKIYHHPKNSFVASFFGMINKVIVTNILVKKFPILNKNIFQIQDNKNLYLYFRPEAISIQSQTDENNICFNAQIISIQYFGSYVLAKLITEEFGNIIAQFSSQEDLKIGNRISLEIKNNLLFYFPD
ncbi:ABC transporter ATP-binding protein [Silvanigrella aquatica]|uniref:ABC transporter domain-containing protein n=1 Tax=Silvanigrella aquatica TaxID=1915309 RepID=A0A1L4D2C0_9BACT|nr:ABC transporter ATP-binding protein [Silvanigrella aquatica]APJ04337.1 hypothetical protein AXG55_10635 [Silvanigrella aquatica]